MKFEAKLCLRITTMLSFKKEKEIAFSAMCLLSVPASPTPQAPFPPQADTCLGSVQITAAGSTLDVLWGSLALRAGHCVESHQPLSSHSHLGLWSPIKQLSVHMLSELPLSPGYHGPLPGREAALELEGSEG